MGATIHQANPKRAMEKFDCIVIGGGPAGSTAAALVAEAGFDTLLLERERFPRFHVGESLMPESYWTLKRLGVLPRLKASRFPCKFSVQFVNHTGEEAAPFYFHDADPRECSQTWQVLRSEFDQMLFENAIEKGADCRQGCRVLDVLLDGLRAVGVRAHTDGDEQPRDFYAPVVVDASGQQTLLASKLGLRKEHARLRKATIWAYYRGGWRDPGVDAGATVIFQSRDRRSWFWYIPLPDDLVSVGVVADPEHLLHGRGTPEAVFEEKLCKCPAVLQRLMHAELVSDFHVLSDFSYVAQAPAGDGWVLVGDALGFVDPIYSSGVFLALKSAEMAADGIIDGLRGGDLSARQLGAWADPFQRGMNRIRRLAEAFYHQGFSVNRFISEYPQHRRNLTDLLMGKVFHDTAGAIFDDLEPWLAAQPSVAADPLSGDETHCNSPTSAGRSNSALN